MIYFGVMQVTDTYTHTYPDTHIDQPLKMRFSDWGVFKRVKSSKFSFLK